MQKFISYLRVSTQTQHLSGLGEIAQQNAIQKYVNGKGDILQQFKEVESGKRTDRPQLKEAIEASKTHSATLIVSKLDRLGRKASHLFAIRDSGIDIIVCDMPDLNTLNFGIFATMAQHEREIISKRTSEALKAKGYKGQVKNFSQKGRIKGAEAMKAKARHNDNNQRAKRLISALIESGKSKAECLRELNRCGFKTSRGKEFQSITQINRLLV